MGKLGKPQKSKRHKKLKNVEGYENSSISRKRTQNLPPKDEDNQEIPKKVQYFIDRKASFGGVKKRKRQKVGKKTGAVALGEVMEEGMTRPMKSAPRFVQGKRESDKQFLKRVEIETQRVLLKSKLSKKYKTDMDEVEAGNVKKKKGMSEAKKKRLLEKKAKKMEKKKEIKDDKKEERQFEDRVSFGEVVMAPPTLTAKPRKSQTENKVDRPGKRSLLLKEIIADNATVSPGSVNRPPQREVGHTLKRKHMSLAQQSIMDSERQRVIDLYRQYRDQKYKIS